MPKIPEGYKNLQQRMLEMRLRRLERGARYLRGGSPVTPSGAWGRVSNSSVTNGIINPTMGGVVASGSLSPTIFPSFVGTVTDTTIRWDWGGPLRRADRSITVITPSSLTVAALSPLTRYYFYPFNAVLGCGVGFVAGNSGIPQFAHSAATDEAAQQQNLFDREPLSWGAMYADTLAAPGTSTVYGGGSTGDIVGGTRPGGCPRDYMVVESAERGVIPCYELAMGERILGPDGEGWTEVVGMELTHCETFVCIRTDGGDEIEISPETPQPMFDGEDEPASLLSLSNRVMVRQPGGGSGYISKLEWVDAPDGKRAVIACAPSHRFWCGRHAPNIAAHNVGAKNLV